MRREHTKTSARDLFRGPNRMAELLCKSEIRAAVWFCLIRADPVHRPELEFELWGTDRDPLSTTRSWRKSQKIETAPPELIGTGYPLEKLSIRRYPREPITQLEPVAFLGLTSASYQSNRTAIATFFPHVVSRGVVAVAPDPLEKAGRNPVDAFLRDAGVNMLFLQVAANYCVGIKP